MCNKLNILSRRKSSHKITEWLCHWLMQMWTHTLLIVVAWPWLAARCPTCSSLTSPQQNSWEKYHETTCRLRQVEKSLVNLLAVNNGRTMRTKSKLNLPLSLLSFYLLYVSGARWWECSQSMMLCFCCSFVLILPLLHMRCCLSETDPTWASHRGTEQLLSLLMYWVWCLRGSLCNIFSPLSPL